jgi:hypothetical protein
VTAVARKTRRVRWQIDRDMVEVPAAEDMDDETFIKHLEKRHADECHIEAPIKHRNGAGWIGVYRAFHDRLHQIATPGQHDHEHALPEGWDEEDEE